MIQSDAIVGCNDNFITLPHSLTVGSNGGCLISIDWEYLEKDRILEMCCQKDKVESPQELYELLEEIQRIIMEKWND